VDLLERAKLARDVDDRVRAFLSRNDFKGMKRADGWDALAHILSQTLGAILAGRKHLEITTGRSDHVLSMLREIFEADHGIWRHLEDMPPPGG
jgi:hypothetical protein